MVHDLRSNRFEASLDACCISYVCGISSKIEITGTFCLAERPPQSEPEPRLEAVTTAMRPDRSNGVTSKPYPLAHSHGLSVRVRGERVVHPSRSGETPTHRSIAAAPWSTSIPRRALAVDECRRVAPATRPPAGGHGSSCRGRRRRARGSFFTTAPEFLSGSPS